MTGHTSGPSRRSHTKSRKGCKTCKRRHIRCDETFPQCRNCTKHQVRCDYMDLAPHDQEASPSSMTDASGSFSLPISPVHSTPRSEESIMAWRATGNFPFPELNVYPAPQAALFSDDELRLIHHLSSLSNNIATKGLNDLTVWTANIPRLLGLLSSFPYVMHALLSFSANNLAWSMQSPDLRKWSIRYGTLALRGLHEDISNFSKANADGILAASYILVSQATDWRTWSSLEAGIQSVTAAMEPWKHESVFGDTLISAQHMHLSTGGERHLPDPQQRTLILHAVRTQLQRLYPICAGRQVESTWLDQLCDYVDRLQASEPAKSPEDQFNHLYVLRKWVYWVPTKMLSQPNIDLPALLICTHLYSTVLALEPLFPDVAPLFCAAACTRPLEATMQRVSFVIEQQSFMQSRTPVDITAAANALSWPQQTLSRYRETHPWSGHYSSSMSAYSQAPNFNFDVAALTGAGNISPAFVPSQMHLSPSQLSSRSHSPYLDVPRARYSYEQSGLGITAGSWGTYSSPGFSVGLVASDIGSQAVQAHSQPEHFDESIFGAVEDVGALDFRGGFVQAPTIWT